MIIDVLPIYQENYDCIENAISSVIKWYNQDYHILFFEAWGFRFIKSTSKDNVSNLNIDEGKGDFTKCVEKYYGIQINQCDFTITTKKDMLILIKDNISKNNPVVLYFDERWIPWGIEHSLRESSRRYHAFIVVGFDDEKSVFLCNDTLPLIYGAELSYDFVEKGLMKCYILKLKENWEYDGKWYDDLENVIFRLKGNLHYSNAFNDMRLFARRLKVADINAIVGPDIEKSRFVIVLDYIAKARVAFSESLNYISINYKIDELNEFYRRFIIFYEKWKTVKLLLVKVSLGSSSSQILAAIKVIEELADEEEAAAEDLQKVCNKYRKIDITNQN